MNVIHHINITDHIKKGITYDLIKIQKKYLIIQHCSSENKEKTLGKLGVELNCFNLMKVFIGLVKNFILTFFCKMLQKNPDKIFG